MSVGAQIRVARTEAGVSQGDLAKRLGLNWQTIQRYESGKRKPPPGFLERALEALAISAPTDAPTRRPAVGLNAGLGPLEAEEIGIVVAWRRLSREGRSRVQEAIDLALASDHARSVGVEEGSRASG